MVNGYDSKELFIQSSFNRYHMPSGAQGKKLLLHHCTTTRQETNLRIVRILPASLLFALL